MKKDQAEQFIDKLQGFCERMQEAKNEAVKGYITEMSKGGLVDYMDGVLHIRADFGNMLSDGVLGMIANFRRQPK